jgi:hypothetical protein
LKRDLTATGILTLLVVLLYRKILRLWWTYDDVYVLHGIIDHNLREWFTSGAVWPQKLFTPLVMVWYEAALALFGLSPERWFVVHLIFIALSAIAFYFALREYFAMPAALAGATLYIVGAPIIALVTELSGIHYFQAVFLGSLATIFYVRAVRGDRMPLSIVSALIYFIGMLAKETVAPLVLLLPFLPVPRDLGTSEPRNLGTSEPRNLGTSVPRNLGTSVPRDDGPAEVPRYPRYRGTRPRIRYAIPHGIALIVYLLWRYAVLDTILGGYGWAVERGDWLPLLLALPKKIVLASAGAGVAAGLVLVAVMLIGVEGAARRRTIVLLLVAFALATGPILPVSKEMQRRYALVPWIVWSVAFIAGAERLRRRHPRAGAALLAFVPLLAVVVNRQEWRHEYGKLLRMSDEGRFFMEMPPDTYLRGPTIPPAALGETNWLKTVHLRKPGGAMGFYDDYFLCTTDVTGNRAWEYQPQRRAVVEITSQLPEIGRRHCASIRRDAPLWAEFDYRDGALFWRFGPYEEGKYRVLIGNGIQAFDVPRKDGFRLPDMTGIALRIRYDSPQGWTTYSDEIALDFVHRPKSRWQR